MIVGVLLGLAAGAVQLILLSHLSGALTSGRAGKAGLCLLGQMVTFVVLAVLGILFWRDALIGSVTAMVAVMVIGSFVRFAVMMHRTGKTKK